VKGLELARRYFADVVLPAFQKRAPGALGRLAFGLAGPGSECYGFDDEISRDHDWGPRVWVWAPEALYREQGEVLQRIYDELERTFLGHGPVLRLDPRARCDGVLSIPRFYQAYLGTDLPPETLRDWLMLPEEGLSTCTNGEVFLDPLGEFTGLREVLLSYFPWDLWLKKIASRCRAAAAHGQYNLWRGLRRADRLTAHHHQAGFARETAALVFLLRRTYRPFGSGHASLEAMEESSRQGLDTDARCERFHPMRRRKAPRCFIRTLIESDFTEKTVSSHKFLLDKRTE
jgi:hypothetical protein